MSDQFSLDSFVVVVECRVFTVCFQSADKAFLKHDFAYIAFHNIFSRSEPSIDAVVKVGFQSFIQPHLYLFESEFVVIRPSIKFFDEALSLKNTQCFIKKSLDYRKFVGQFYFNKTTLISI